MSTNRINPTERTDEYLDSNKNFNPNANVDAVGNFNYQSWDGGTGVGSKGNVEKLASDYINYNYDSFTKGSDYASLAKRYSDNGRKAMDDTVGQVAARTGGLASSYATVAGQQTYGDWMSRLEDAARSLYDSQKSEKMNAYNLAQGLYDRGYSEYKDGYDNAFNKWKTAIGIAQGKDTNATEMYKTGLGAAQWYDEVTTDQNNEDRDRDDDLRSEEEDSLYDYIYAGGSYDSYGAYAQANDGKTLLSEADFNRIVATATGNYSEDNKTTRDEEIGTIIASEDFIWGDWDGDGTVEADGESKSFEDVFGGSSYGQEYWEKYYTRIREQADVTSFQNNFNNIAAYDAEGVLGCTDLAAFNSKYGITSPTGFSDIEFKAMQAELKATITGSYDPNMTATEVNEYFERYEKGLKGEEGGSTFMTPGMLKAFEHYNGIGYFEQKIENGTISGDTDVANAMDKWHLVDPDGVLEYLSDLGINLETDTCADPDKLPKGIRDWYEKTYEKEITKTTSETTKTE